VPSRFSATSQFRETFFVPLDFTLPFPLLALPPKGLN
jgi:hypothetical protein